METSGTVDPEIQGSVSNLVSALGGVDPESNVYKLGDEALACLRDLRKWLQNYDAKYDRLEVATAIANTTLVTNDIPEILSIWEKLGKKARDPYMDRIALACLELLVPLTWPIDIVGKEGALEQFSQSLFSKARQIQYKHALISFPSHNVLSAILKLAASSLSVSLKDREPRDEGIITLVCSFFRNSLAVNNEKDQDRALVVKELKKQKVLNFILSVTSSMRTQFDTQDTVLLETVYYLVRSVDVQRVYKVHASEDPVYVNANKNLKQMLDIEDDMDRAAFKPTRHSRFGTLISLNYGKGDQMSLSGQRGVSGLNASVNEINSKKRWHKPKGRNVNDDVEKGSFMTHLSTINSDNEALEVIRDFTDDFLDSSFNPLFSKIRQLIEKMASVRVTKKVCIIYCFLLGWSIDAERTRAVASNRQVDFQLIGDALKKGTFAVVTKLLANGLESGELRSTDLVHSAMFAFRQILLTVRSMSYSDDQDLRDIADGMKSRLFYEDQWLSMLPKSPRSSHRKSLVYACEAIALTHVISKMSDEFSKQHTYMFVKTKRLRRKKSQKSDESVRDDEVGQDVDTPNDHQEAARVTNERRFTFEKFVIKYINDPTISVYERILDNFKEVGSETLSQVFSFFRRTFAKTTCKAVFYRMSLMRSLLTLVDRQGSAPESKVRIVADEFSSYFVRKFVSTSSEMPSLHIQVNEIITPDDAYYYDHHGRDKERYKPPAFEYTLTDHACHKFNNEKQIAIIVAAIIDNDGSENVKWIENKLMSYVNEKREKNIMNGKATKLPLDMEKMKIVHSDGLSRLSSRSLGLIVHVTEGKVVIPSDLDELAFLDRSQWVSKYQREAVDFPDNRTARDYIKREGELDPSTRSDDDYDLHDDTSIFSRPSETKDYRTNEDDQNSLSHEESVRSLFFEEEQVDSTSLAKRTHSDAFALENSDDDANDDVLRSIESVRRRKTILDDEDD